MCPQDVLSVGSISVCFVRVLFICIIQQKNVPSLQSRECQYCRVQHQNCEVLNEQLDNKFQNHY
ncbi:hypothetical protein DPMN_159668 [Dreissena polymorpha]|uniref:Uncharacterized protein n=1 Tax=Dreissena polymorpha TaxID=45954 RepID=A0A9D4EJG4_DREPO|nr:hypothetical protein DPMN_159668 [Dreissena polymorpha]